jgi:hypothetical protein
MTKRKLIEEIKLNPQRYYRAPNDVNRDRRFSDEERLQILGAWERDMRSSDSGHDDGDMRLQQLADARAEVEKRMPLGTQRPSEPKLGAGE